MKRYYANLLGEWVDVSESCQIVGLLPDDEPGEAEYVDSEFVRIFREDGMYIVHKSLIQVFDDEA